MKKLWAVFAILLAFTLTTEVAHAKRFGGGKSFGRTYQTTPSQPSKSSADVPAQRQQMAGQPAKVAGKGMMGGLLGGLLVGGLFAALFAGGAFEGLQFMDILIAAALAFVAFKIFRLLRQGNASVGAPVRTPQPAYAGTPNSVPPVFGSRRDSLVSSAPVSASSDAVPMSLPLGFDTPAFLDGAKEHYRTLQDAWNQNDLAKIEEYATPALYAELVAERASLPGAQHTEVIRVDSELVRADEKFGLAEVSIRFSGRYRDTVEGVEEDFTDVWHLERDGAKAENPWLITGIQSA
ncbi:MAG: TIM44-like domain-containing protein [Pseudomonadota bacterium]